jgi:hypothetical protein
MKRHVPLDEARARVAKLLFDSDRNLKLTKEQQKVYDDHGPKFKPVYEGGVLDRHIEVFDRPCPPHLRDLLDAAIGRAHRIRVQGITVDDWLATWISPRLFDRTYGRFEVTDDVHGAHTASVSADIPCAVLDEAIEKYQATTVAVAPKAVSTKPGPKPTLFEQVEAATRAEIAKGRLSEQGLAGMTQEKLAETLGVGRELAVKVRNAILNTDKAEINSDKSRQGGK